jgi:hypothetical protein
VTWKVCILHRPHTRSNPNGTPTNLLYPAAECASRAGSISQVGEGGSPGIARDEEGRLRQRRFRATRRVREGRCTERAQPRHRCGTARKADRHAQAPKRLTKRPSIRRDAFHRVRVSGDGRYARKSMPYSTTETGPFLSAYHTRRKAIRAGIPWSTTVTSPVHSSILVTVLVAQG